MKGPVHYRIAEGLVLAAASNTPTNPNLDTGQVLAIAQIHATLAHAAAVAETGSPALSMGQDQEWKDAFRENHQEGSA